MHSPDEACVVTGVNWTAVRIQIQLSSVCGSPTARLEMTEAIYWSTARSFSLPKYGRLHHHDAAASAQAALLRQPERNAHFSHLRACGLTVGLTSPLRSA